MTDGWEGVTGNSVAYSFQRCYTSLPHDLTAQATATHSMQYASYIPQNLITGIFCGSYPGVYYTGNSLNAWWQVDFGSPKTVSRIRLKVSKSYYSQVSFYLGNSSTYSHNSVVAGPEQTEKSLSSVSGRHSVEVDIQPSTGQYFTIVQAVSSWLGMYSVQIF